MKSYAAELVQRNIAVILAVGPQAVLALSSPVFRTIPAVIQLRADRVLE